MQHSTSIKRGRGKAIPFGVRAIESGIEVDGVWISGTNTPAMSTPPSPAISAKPEDSKHTMIDPAQGRNSSSSILSQLEIPQAAHGHHGGKIRRPDMSTKSSGSIFDRMLASDTPSNRQPSVSVEHDQFGRPTYQPRRSSGLRYSDSHVPDNSITLAALQGQRISTDRNGKRRGNAYLLVPIRSLC